MKDLKGISEAWWAHLDAYPPKVDFHSCSGEQRRIRRWAFVWRVLGLSACLTAVLMAFAGFSFIEIWLMLGLGVIAAARFMYWRRKDARRTEEE